MNEDPKALGAPWWAWVVWGVVTVGSVLAAPHLPPRIATHFGVNGAPNGYSNRWVGALLQPGIMLILLLGWQVLWRLDPRRRNYTAMALTYRWVGGLIIGFLALAQTFLLLHALGWVAWNAARLLGASVGVFVVLLANVLPRVQPNWWLGIRTPWTLSDEAVWRRTHRFGGQVGVVAGLAMVAASLALPTAWSGIVTVTIAMLWGVGLVVASYWFFAQSRDRENVS
ncbi:MAG: SdpI family protein [Firmicutes bacterium]|nr:SdpI family protein [Alicyclobacillaceae bacterium]MCL6498132.1 SdpI family protein [Bacillota bacterium]